MKTSLLVAASLLAAGSAHAKDQLIKLSADDAAQLQGKQVALTAHERPSFVAMTAGKVTFGLLGVAAMVSAGNKIVDDNHVADPADLVRDQLGSALANAFGAKVAPVDTQKTKAQKPKDIAALHPESDYVLDVRSGGWNSAYYPTKWGTYWVGYSVQVQLVDTKTGRQVSNAACNTTTQANPNPPTREELVADGAQLLKDVTTALGWTCVQLLAREQFSLPADKIAATPASYADPLAARKAAAPASTPTAAAVATDTPPAVTGTPPAAEHQKTPAAVAEPSTEGTPAPSSGG